MGALNNELKQLVWSFAAHVSNPTLQKCIAACRGNFSEDEVKHVVDELVAAGRLELESQLTAVPPGDTVSVIRLRAVA